MSHAHVHAHAHVHVHVHVHVSVTSKHAHVSVGPLDYVLPRGGGEQFCSLVPFRFVGFPVDAKIARFLAALEMGSLCASGPGDPVFAAVPARLAHG